MIKKIYISQIIEFFNKKGIKYQFFGNLNDSVEGFSSFNKYKLNTLSWVKNNELFNELFNENNIYKLLIFDFECNVLKNNIKNYFLVSNSKYVFFSILDYFYKEEDTLFSKNTYISKTANLGKNVRIGSNCVIGENVVIGDNTIISNNVVIERNVRIGSNCLIQSGAIIGEIGFGFSQSEDGFLTRVPHYGSVVIGDNVDIGSNTAIARGTIDDTVIGDGVKIENLCHIGHNVVIGKNTTLITHTSIYGSVVIGENCYISTSVIRNQLKIGNNVTIGMGSVVVKDVSDDLVVFGNPAKVKI